MLPEPSGIPWFYSLVVLFLPEAHVIVARLNDNVEQQTIAGKKPGFDNRCGLTCSENSPYGVPNELKQKKKEKRNLACC